MSDDSGARAVPAPGSREPDPQAVPALTGFDPSRIKPQNYERMTQPERAQLRACYVEAQGGRCRHCGESLQDDAAASIRAKPINWKRFPPNFLRHPVHLHHSHRSGMTIGAVHAYCNAYLWQYHGE